MKTTIPSGVWPTMLTPFSADKKLDLGVLDALTDWYLAQGVHGLFAVCQSSEMFMLTLEERATAARRVVDKAGARAPVIASGHTADRIEDQIYEIQSMMETGILSFVMLTNRLAAPGESDEIWKSNAYRILNAIPDANFGLYECPHPYKRLMNPGLLRWCQDTERFSFLKDTCCEPGEIGVRLKALQGGSLQLFNANSATLLASLQSGAAGFSGIMANYHPALYVWLTENWRSHPDTASRLQDFLGLASVIESQYYPVDAKYNLQLSGVPIALTTRVKDADGLQPAQRIVVEQLKRQADEWLTVLRRRG